MTPGVLASTRFFEAPYGKTSWERSRPSVSPFYPTLQNAFFLSWLLLPSVLRHPLFNITFSSLYDSIQPHHFKSYFWKSSTSSLFFEFTNCTPNYSLNILNSADTNQNSVYPTTPDPPPLHVHSPSISGKFGVILDSVFFQNLCPNSPASSIHFTFKLCLMSLDMKLITVLLIVASVQFSPVAQLCLTLCEPMNRSTTGLPVHHQLPEFAQTHIHWVGDAIQPSHPLSSPSPPAPNPS